jgi:glutathione S-transferase
MMILYQYDISPFCDKVRRALRLKGLDYTTQEILPSAGKKWRHISPTGKFPALAHAGQIIVDSTDILYYLETIQPSPPLYPTDPHARAMCLLLEDWADEALYFYDLTMRNWPQNRRWFLADLLRHEKPFVRRLMAPLIPGALLKIAKTQGIGRKSPAKVTQDLERLYASLAELVARRLWLVADHLSAADLAVFAMVNVLKRTQEGAALLSSQPDLTRWYSDVAAATDD